MSSHFILCMSCRLISERTVEENILRKANQKKLLGDLAIEGGNFTSAYFKSVSIFLLNSFIPFMKILIMKMIVTVDYT